MNNIAHLISVTDGFKLRVNVIVNLSLEIQIQSLVPVILSVPPMYTTVLAYAHTVY